MAARGTSVNVPEFPDRSMYVFGEHHLNGRVLGVVEAREDGFGAVTRNREATTVVGIALGEGFGEGGGFVREGGGVMAGIGGRNCCSGARVGVEADAGENFVGFFVGEEADGEDTARDGASDGEGAREVCQGRCVLEVTLREVDHLVADMGKMNHGTCTGVP